MNAVLPKNLEDFGISSESRTVSKRECGSSGRLEQEMRDLPLGRSSARELEKAYAAETNAERDWENRGGIQFTQGGGFLKQWDIYAS